MRIQTVLDIPSEPPGQEVQLGHLREIVAGKAVDLHLSAVLGTAAWPCLGRRSRFHGLQRNLQLLRTRRTLPDTHTASPYILAGEILAADRRLVDEDLDDLNLRVVLEAFPVVEQGMIRLRR